MPFSNRALILFFKVIVPSKRPLNSATTSGMDRSGSSSSPGTEIEDTLWVDRYRPRKFTDLLGNEKVARDAMTWVKDWDYCVFGKSRGKKRGRDDDENVNLDEFRRPQEKVKKNYKFLLVLTFNIL